ncbi:MAG: glucose-6-phosphate dehydrogenase assembly protein OpcA [Planctomycetota bacterium]
MSTVGATPELVRLPRQIAAVDRLPEALRELWRAVGGEDAQRARSLTINLVGYASATGEQQLEELVGRVMGRSPARAFLLVADGRSETPHAEVGATVRCTRQNHDVIQEEIRLRFPPAWFQHVPGIVRPLLVNDLPNHLFWADDWNAEAAFDALARLCERTAVDSRRFTLPAVQLPELERRRSDGLVVNDLSWLRLRPWRRALAEAFERAAWQPGTPVTGIVRHGPNAVAAAILLGQWLEGRLAARIELEEGEGDGSCPEAVELRFLDTSIVAQSLDRQRIEIAVSTAAQCFLPFQVPRSVGADGDLLAAAIDIA